MLVSVFIATSLDGYIARADDGLTLQGFLREDFDQRLTITRIPVLLGSCTPFFGDLPRDLWLEHVVART